MKLAEYKRTLKHKPGLRTLVFLVDSDRVLLGHKKRGFGKGNYLGIGGKVEVNETIEEAAKREVLEEIKVTVGSLKQAAVLNFYFPHIADESWNQQVYAFIATDWQGQLSETEEIKPDWFQIKEIPFDKMWDDNKYWLPEILKGEELKMDFIFDERLKVIEFS